MRYPTNNYPILLRRRRQAGTPTQPRPLSLGLQAASAANKILSRQSLLLIDQDGTVVKTWNIDDLNLYLNDIEFIADLRRALEQGRGLT